MATPVIENAAAASGPPATLAAAQAFRYDQALFGAIMIRDILALWGQLDPARIAATWPAVSRAISALAVDRFTQSSAAGVAFYEAMKAISLGGAEAGGYTVVAPVVPQVLLIERVLRMTGPSALQRRLAGGQPIRIAFENTGVDISGAMARLALQAAREVVSENVIKDPKALAWMRVLGPRPCGFCAMLAARGPVYRSAQAAGFRAHNHCMCAAAPAFRKEDVKALTNDEFYKLWQKVTHGYSGKNAINAWRRYWNGRDGSVPQPFETFRGL